jgi:hypothetical protein
LICNGTRDSRAIVPHIHAPQSRQAIEQAAVILIHEEATITRLDQMGARFVHVQMMREWMKVILLIE